jgi:serine phosphatase RsbU (regulator of sigma subunit)
VTRGAPGKMSWRPAVTAALAGVAGFLLATRGESLIIGAVRGDRAKLEWISDTVVSLGVVGLTYLWLNLRQSRVRVLALEREQIVLDEQLRLAAEIQRSLLPDLPPATAGFGWAARMVPAGRIGGDFYDLVQPGPRTAFAILGDVSGKGIPAALLLSSLKTLFRATVPTAGGPAAVAERIASALYEQYGGMPYVTAILARFDADGPRLEYVNAGHPPGYLLRGGGATPLGAGGPPLGMLPGATYTAATLDLRRGDVGVLVTDGITEALDASLGAWVQRLAAAAGATAAPPSARATCDELMEGAARAGGTEDGGQDDRTVFVFTVESDVHSGASSSERRSS